MICKRNNINKVTLGLEITTKIWVFVWKPCLRIWIFPSISWLPVRKPKFFFFFFFFFFLFFFFFFFFFVRLFIYLAIPGFLVGHPAPDVGFHHHFLVSWKSGNPVISSSDYLILISAHLPVP